MAPLDGTRLTPDDWEPVDAPPQPASASRPLTPDDWEPVDAQPTQPAQAAPGRPLTADDWEPVTAPPMAPTAPTAPQAGPRAPVPPMTGDPELVSRGLMLPEGGPMPEDTRQGIGGATMRALYDKYREGKKLVTGNAFSDADPAPPPVERTIPGDIAYALTSASPVLGMSLATGAGGAAAGSAIAPGAGTAIGGLTGATIGAAGTDFALSLVPAYEEARRSGLPHDEAVNQAFKVAAANGVFTAATTPLFAWAPFKSVVGNMLFHAFATGPVTGAVKQIGIDPVVTGQPMPTMEDVGKAGLVNAATGLAQAAILHTAPKLIPRRGATDRNGATTEPIPDTTGQTETPPQTGPVPPTPTSTPTYPGPFSELVRPPAPGEAVPAPETQTLRTPPDATPGSPPLPPDTTTARPAGEPPATGTPGTDGVAPPPGATRTVPVDETPAGRDVPAPPVSGEPALPRTSAPVEPEHPVTVPGQEPPVPGDTQTRPTETPPETPPEQAAAKPVDEPAAVKPTEPEPVAPTEPPRPAAPEPPAKRPVSQSELDALNEDLTKARAQQNRAFKAADTPPEKLAALTQKVAEAQAARDAAEGPPTKPAYIKAPPGAMEAHQEAVTAHEAAVAQRVHAEGEAPVPSPKDIGGVFRMNGSQDMHVIRVTDPAGNPWVGTGSAMTRENVLGKAAAQAEKLKTSKTSVLGDGAFERAIQPKAGVTFEPVTWERRVTSDGRDLVVGTMPDGTHVAVQKPVYDTLHAAAGPGGKVTAAGGARKGGKSGTDERLFAHNAKGELTGVGMPFRLKQDVARVYARGRPAPEPAPKPVPAPVADSEDLQLRGGSRRSTTASGTAPGRGAAGTPTEPPLPKRNQPKPPPKPIIPPKPGQPLTFHDYAYSEGTPAYRDAFHEALHGSGEDPNTMINKPIGHQVEVLSQQLKKKYGFKDVIVEPSADPKTTRDQLLNMHHNMQNMAHSLGWSPGTMSLNGRLSLKLVPRNFQGGHWYGAYSFADNTVHISGGSNSFAHEHWHGTDDYLSELLNKNPNRRALLSWNARDAQLDPADPVQSAFARVINRVFFNKGDEALRRLQLERTASQVTKAGQPTQSALAAQKQIELLDKGASQLRITPSDMRARALAGPNPQYFASAHEMLARAGEAYTAHRMEMQGHDTSGVVKSDKAYRDQLLLEIKHRYPNPQDRIDIFRAFDDLNHELNKSDLLHQGMPPAQPADETHTMVPWSRRQVADNKGALAADLKALRPRNLFNRGQHDPLLFNPDKETAPLDYSTRSAGKGKPKPKTVGAQAYDTLTDTIYSARAKLERYRDQSPEAARPHIQEVIDRLATSPGTGRVLPETYTERHEGISIPMMNELGDNFRDLGFTNFPGRRAAQPVRLTKQQNAELYHTATTGDKTFPLDPGNPASARRPIGDNIIQASTYVRKHMDALWHIAKKAGLDLGYVKGGGYMPRVFNDAKIRNDQSGFVKQRARLNTLMMDRDIDASADQPKRLGKWWDETNSEIRKGTVFPDKVKTDMQRLRSNLRRIDAIDAELAAGPGGPGVNPTTHNPTALRAERDLLKIDNQQIHDQHRATVTDTLTRIEAKELWDKIAKGHVLDFTTMGPDSKFTRGRELPPETDEIMRDYLHQNVVEAISHYTHNVSRKVAYHERFGEQGEAVLDLMGKAIDAGMPPEYGEKINQIVELVTGRSMRDWDPSVHRISNLVSTIGALNTLGRSGLATMVEPFQTALATRDYRQMASTYGHMFTSLLRLGNAAEVHELTRMVGVTRDGMHAGSNSRMADYSNTPGTEKLMREFFELAQGSIQRWIRASSTAPTIHAMKRNLHYATEPATGRADLNRQDEAKILMRDYGISDEQMPKMRDFLDQFPGAPTRTAAAEHDMGPLFSLALRRALDRVSLNPTPADKPMGSLKNPLLNMFTQLTAFPYKFAQMVLEPRHHMLVRAYEREHARQIAAGTTPTLAAIQARGAQFHEATKTALAAASLLAGTALMYVPRMYLLNHDTWKKHADAGDLGSWLTGGVMSASGIVGPIDIVAQSLTSIRYMSDLSNLVEGPYLSSELRYALDIARGVGSLMHGAATGTNTEVYNAIYGLQQLVVVPGAMALLSGLASRLPAGGPLSKLLTATMITGLSSTVTRGITNELAGPRGTKMKVHKPGELPALRELPSLDRHKKKADEGGILPSWAMGLVDDVVAPAMRVVPGVGKVIVGGAGAGLGVASLLYKGHQFKTHGTPPAKAH